MQNYEPGGDADPRRWKDVPMPNDREKTFAEVMEERRQHASPRQIEDMRRHAEGRDARDPEDLLAEAMAKSLDLPNSPRRMRGKAGKIIEDCLESDEPVFILRGKDIFTPMVLTEYLKLVESYGPTNFEFVQEISDCLQAIKDWQHHNTNRVRYPD